jgi:hypothetical protein
VAPATRASAGTAAATVWYALRMSQSGLHPVRGRVITSEFGVDGSFHHREAVGTAWMLNATDRPYLPMTGLTVYRRALVDPPAADELLYQTDFAAIPKAHIRWLTGGAPDTSPEGQGRQLRHVHLLYADHVLAGSFLVRPELRLSDFVTQAVGAKPYITLLDARVLLPGPAGTPISELPTAEAHAFLTVNLRLVGGIFDVRGEETA